MKRWIGRILALVLALTLIPGAEAAEHHRALAEVLRTHRDRMLAYETQLTEGAWTVHGSVYFADLDRDGLEEMVLLRPIGEGDLTTGVKVAVEIAGGAEGETMLQSEPAFMGFGSGKSYALFRLEEDLLLVNTYGDISGSGRFYDRIFWDGEAYRLDRILESVSQVQDDFTTYAFTCRGDGQEISQEEYKGRERELLDTVEGCIFSDLSVWVVRGEDQLIDLALLPDEAMTVPQAEQYLELQNELDRTPYSQEEAGRFLSLIGGRQYVFASGAGGWGDILNLAPDGSFTGLYSDSNMGEEDPALGTLGAEYYCSYSGRMNQVRKVSDYCYLVTLDTAVDTRPGKVEVIDRDLKRVYTDLAGLQHANAVLVFIPGQPMAELPEPVRTWAMPLTEDQEILTHPAIYNPVSESGATFFSFDQGAEIPVFPDPAEDGDRLVWEVEGPVDMELVRDGQVIGGIRDGEPYGEITEANTVTVPGDCSLRLTARRDGTVQVKAYDRDGSCVAAYEQVELRAGDALEAGIRQGVPMLHEEASEPREEGGNLLLLVLGIAGLLLTALIVVLLLILRKPKKGRYTQ